MNEIEPHEDEVKCYEKLTDLQHAVYHRDYELAEFLLAKLGHNPDLCGSIDIPPISLAADANDFKMVELLIKHGADVSATDGDGRAAIFYCKSDKMLEIFEAHGAVRDSIQMLTICRVVADIKRNGFATTKQIESLIRYEKPLFGNAKENIILLAARYGDTKTLKLLSPYLHQVKPDSLISAVFSCYELNGVTYHKDVDKLIELTDILIQGGVVKESSDALSSTHIDISLKPEKFINTPDNKASALLENISKLGLE